jgi:sigma-B regulation protein RsbU (phosphoserine phosphatase)
MMLSPRYFRMKLADAGLLPTSKVARVACYVLGLDLLLFALQEIGGWLKLSFADSLGGWVSFLSFVAILLFLVLAIRWARAKMLWRLRNRLIVTYVFIGVIPVVLLMALAVGSFYLFAGQFATFIVTTGLDSELVSLESANNAIAQQVAAQMKHGRTGLEAFQDVREADKIWADRQICVWLGQKMVVNSAPADVASAALVPPSHLGNSFHGIVRDHDRLYLRAMQTVTVGGDTMTVLSSEPFDQHMLQELAANLGEISLYTTGLNLRKVERGQGKATAAKEGSKVAITSSKPEGDYVLDTGKETPRPTYTAGAVPPAASWIDPQFPFGTTVSVVDWDTGGKMQPAAIGVQTRVSKIYQRLFAALGDLAPAVEFGLLFVAIFFAIIEMVALVIGTSLTRTVTGTVAQLYDATTHINRGDFQHRIPVKSNDQIAALANSFNSMTASLEKLIAEQKEKQKLENELVIAQEVQSQLFPHHITQLASLEVHGFCRPASTVSGDYYDFLTLDSERLILAVGDISGKGISAALLMATIHSAVRAYSLQDIPALREPMAVGAASGSAMRVASRLHNLDVSPSALLSLLNHQLYESTPSEKYATLFLGIYNGAERQLTYTNGGHLPPIVMSEDGSVRRLECGGTVVGLFDHVTYEESSVQLRKGEMLLAYSDGVTEPENEFGEFGEQRLIELVRENRDLPLPRISEIVTAAVDDWIGANQQPDDVTLVLARAR